MNVHLRANENPTYVSWYSMSGHLKRTQRIYGAIAHRCDRWKDYEKFLEDMGPRPPGKVLVRLNLFGGYSPENCYWGTLSETRISNRLNYVDYMIGKKFDNWQIISFTRRHQGKRMYLARCGTCLQESEIAGERFRNYFRVLCPFCKANYKKLR